MKNFYAKILLIPLLCMMPLLTWGQIISQYVETNSGTTPKGIEIWNNTAGVLNFATNNLIIQQGTNGGAPSTLVTVNTGTLAVGAVMVIGTSDIGTYLTGQGLTSVTFVTQAFAFNGDDALVVKYGSTTTDMFGTAGSDPGTDWSGGGVSTANSNIALNTSITTGDTDGWTNPSTRFTTVSTTPATLPAGLAGFGQPPVSASSPEIQLQYNTTSTDRACGGSYAFGSQTISTNTDLTVRIRNSGTAALSVSSFSGLSAPFSLVSPPATPFNISAGSYQDITLRYSPTSAVTTNQTLTINNGDADEGSCTIALSGTGIVLTSSNTDVVAVSSSEASVISSIENTSTISNSLQGVQVWQITIRDGGAGLNDADALPTTVTSIVLAQAAGNAVDTWNTAIQSVAIFDGTTFLANGVVSSNQITFSGSPLVSIADGTQKTLSIRLSLKNPLPTDAPDGDDFGFSLSNANFTTGALGVSSQKTTFSAQTSANGQNVIQVIATELRFVTQPSNTAVNATMTSPTVQATDANGNRDQDFTANIAITSSGTLNATPKNATAASGLATFNDIIHTASGTGFTLNAASAGLTSTTSSAFDIIIQTVFKPGDLVFVGFDAQEFGSGSEDGVYIMTMVDIVPSTSFTYINSRFEAGAAACTRTMRWGGSGDNPDTDPGYLTFTWNGSSSIAAGSIIKFITTGSPSGTTEIYINNTSTNQVSNFTIIGTGSPNISSSAPDQLWLAQGSFTGLGSGNVQFEGQVLYGFSNGNNWIPFGTACSGVNGSGAVRQARLHPDIECFNWVDATRREVAYYKTPTSGSPIHTGTKRQLLQSIGNTSNWNTGTTVPSGRLTNTFTINSGNPEGTWVGDDATNPNDWFTCGNWEGLAVPDRNLDVVIPDVTNAARIDVDGYGAGCVGSYTSDKYLVGGVRMAECKSLTLTGETLEFGNGSSNSGSTADRLDIYGNLTINSTAGGVLDMDAGTSAQDGTINLQGNWFNNLSTSFVEGNSNINLMGADAQTITNVGGTETFANITFNNSAGITLNATNMLIAGTATFTQGNVLADATPTSTTYSPRVEFLAGSTASGANNNSYVRGWVRKIGNTAFTFPVGDEGFYASIGISAPSNAAHHFTAMYEKIKPNPYDINAKVISLDHVGNCEYWMLNRTNGASNVNVTLSYDNIRSCGITAGEEADLRVARWDGAIWQDEGNTAYNTTTVTSAVVNNFSPFTLASITNFNPLPIELLSFAGEKNPQGENLLHWVTAQEINNKGFELQRSFDGKHFQKVEFIQGVGNSFQKQFYQYLDKNCTQGAYYRLLQIDFDGTQTLSQTIFIPNIQQENPPVLFPNPLLEGQSVRLVYAEDKPLHLNLYTTQGQILLQAQGTVQSLENQLNIALRLLPKSMYLVEIITETGIFREKLIKY